MRLLATIAPIVGLVVIDGPVRGGADESLDAYEIAAATAVPVLPPPLRAFFQAHLAAFQHSAAPGLVPTSSPEALPGMADWHYVMVDAAAGGGDEAVRHAAAHRFPRDRAAAIGLYKRHGLRDGGSLPWVVCSRYAALVRAFQAGKEEAILREAGALLHFATDASLPFNTTANRDGQATGNLHWPVGAAKDASPSHITVRHRYHIGLVGRLRNRFDYEVRVSPHRYGQVRNPIDAVFDVLLETHGVVDALLAIDAEAMAELGITDAETFAATSNAYYNRLADRAASIVESRLEAAALLCANLIGTAWVEAGTPPPGAQRAATPRMANRAGPPSKAGSPYVGSRQSTIFHRATCSHAKRIKPTNCVHFNTAQEARDAGRTPCKSCRPGDS